MIPEIFTILNASAPVKVLLGTNPLRVFPFGQAPQDVERPYATYSVYNGVPENTLNCPPDIDNIGTQIDVWSPDADDCITIAEAIRDALEGSAHMTNFQSLEWDDETGLYRTRMDFDFWTQR